MLTDDALLNPVFKKIFLAFLFLPFFGFSQPKGCNAIVLHGVSFSQIDDSLNARGFQIDKLDSISLTTKSKEYYSSESGNKKDHASIVLSVRIKGNDATLTALYTYDENENSVLGAHTQSGKPTRVENIYSKGSFMRRAFDYMDGFAKSLTSNISYTRL
jgi:hypothetical protein